MKCPKCKKDCIRITIFPDKTGRVVHKEMGGKFGFKTIEDFCILRKEDVLEYRNKDKGENI